MTKKEVEVSQRKAEMGDLVTRVGVGEGGAERHGSWFQALETQTRGFSLGSINYHCNYSKSPP